MMMRVDRISQPPPLYRRVRIQKPWPSILQSAAAPQRTIPATLRSTPAAFPPPSTTLATAGWPRRNAGRRGQRDAMGSTDTSIRATWPESPAARPDNCICALHRPGRQNTELNTPPSITPMPRCCASGRKCSSAGCSSSGIAGRPAAWYRTIPPARNARTSRPVHADPDACDHALAAKPVERHIGAGHRFGKPLLNCIGGRGPDIDVMDQQQVQPVSCQGGNIDCSTNAWYRHRNSRPLPGVADHRKSRSRCLARETGPIQRPTLVPEHNLVARSRLIAVPQRCSDGRAVKRRGVDQIDAQRQRALHCCDGPAVIQLPIEITERRGAEAQRRKPESRSAPADVAVMPTAKPWWTFSPVVLQPRWAVMRFTGSVFL